MYCTQPDFTLLENMNIAFEYKENIKKIIKEFIKIRGSFIRKIILFGSCSREDMGDNSDIDICVITHNDGTSDCDTEDILYTSLYSDRDSVLLVDHDLLVLTESQFLKNKTNRSSIVPNIIKEGVVLYDYKQL